MLKNQTILINGIVKTKQLDLNILNYLVCVSLFSPTERVLIEFLKPAMVSNSVSMLAHISFPLMFSQLCRRIFTGQIVSFVCIPTQQFKNVA